MLFMVADSSIVKAASADPAPSPQGNGGNDTAPPPVVSPPPAPDRPQGPVEHGTVTQGWDNASPVSQIADRGPARLVESDGQVLYETSYGNFFLSKVSPYFVGVSSRQDITGESKVAESAFLVRYNNSLLIPTDGKLDLVSPNLLVFSYRLMAGGKLAGTLTVTYTFYDNRNKISASFVPSIGLPEDLQIVWLTFTTFDVIDVTTMPADVEQRFEDLQGYGGVLQFPPNYEVLSAVGMPSTVVKPTKGASLNRESAGLHINVDDALNDSPRSYAGKFSFSGFSGNAVLTAFAAGHLTIDPQLLLSGVDQDATSFSGVQRKTFYDGDRYWIFYKYTGGGASEIRYQSSIEGKSWTSFVDAVQIPGTFPFNFAVANYGKTVAVVWVDSASLTAIQIRTGLITSDTVQWDGGARVLYTTGTSITKPVGVTFTGQGNQLGFTWVESVGDLRFQRFTCTGQGVSGFSYCAQGTLSQLSLKQPTGDHFYNIPIAFNGDTGAIGVVRAVEITGFGQTYFDVTVYRDDGTSCDTNGMTHNTEKVGDAVINDGLFTATAYGNVVDVFFRDGAGAIRSWLVDQSCVPTQDTGIGTYASAAKYLTAGTTQDGGLVYLFYTEGSPSTTIRYSEIIPKVISGTGFDILPSYSGPCYVTAAQYASHFIPLMFASDSLQSGACNIGYSSTYRLYYVNYPLPLDGEAAVNNPWASKLGAPLVTDTGGVVSPTTGLAANGQVLVKGTPSISILYREPGLFYQSGGKDAPFTRNGYWIYAGAGTSMPGMWFDLPWIDYEEVHMQGGQNFPLSVTGQSGNFRWYNNTKGMRYTLKYDSAATKYTLTLPSGVYIEFLSGGGGSMFWAISKVYLDTTGANYVTYAASGGLLTSIVDSSGRSITYTSSTGTLGYGNGQVVRLAKILGAFSGCSDGTSSDSGVLWVNDTIGRSTKYSVCHWKLVKLESPNGGRVDYTYVTYNANPGPGNQVWQGTEAYSLPLVQMDIYNESGAGTKARTLVFNWNFQNGEVVKAAVNSTDKSGVVQGINEYVFNSALGTASVRAYDSAGQVLYYDMETCTAAPCGSNPMKDLSGSANTGTFGGSGYTFPSARYGKGTNFAGAAWIQASDSNSLDATNGVTLSAWVKPSSLTGIQRIISKWGDTTGEMSYLLSMGDSGNPGQVRFAVRSGGSSIIADGSGMDTSSWWQVVGTYDGKTARVYVNGAIIGACSVSCANQIQTIQVTTTPVRVGDEGDGSGTYKFQGTIDEVRIFNRELSPEDIGILYTKNGLKKGEQQNWYSINDQPHMVEGFVGDETSASVVTQDAIDDWGNQIYHRDALGNETFASYANTNRQNHFYAPGRLAKTGTSNTEFIDFNDGKFPTGQGAWVVTGTNPLPVAIDYSTFDKVTPSIRLNADSSQTTNVIHTSPISGATFIEFRMRTSSIAQQLEFDFWSAGQQSLMGPRLHPSEAGLLYAKDTYNSVSQDVSCKYLNNAFVYLAANVWYRFTMEVDTSGSQIPYNLYLNGITLTCGTGLHLSYAPGNIFWMLISSTASSGPWSAWVDDVKIYANSNGQTGYSALNIGFSGLLPRQSIRLLGEDGSVIDQMMQTVAGTTLWLSFNSALTGAYKYYENGDNAKTIVQIYAEDGTLEYQSPLTRFFVGAQYTYARPRAFADELIRVRDGAVYWPSPNKWADEPINPGVNNCPQGSTSCGGTWSWRAAPDARGALRGTYVHTTVFDYGYREHYFTMPGFLYGTSFDIVTHIRITSGKSPDGISLYVDFPSGGGWKEACWGTCHAGGYRVGGVPTLRDQWIQLALSLPYFGGTGNWDGIKYGLSGGEADWDLTTTRSDTDATPNPRGLSVTGLNALGTSRAVWVVDADGAVLAGPTYQSGDVATFGTFIVSPVIGRLKISDYTFPSGPEHNVYYLGPIRLLWSGDMYQYLGQSSFFDPKTSDVDSWPSSAIHTAQIGAKRFSGDCLDALLCYDMESLTEGAIAVDTGTVTVSMKDLSTKGNDGTATNAALSTIAKSAAGLASSFDGTSGKLLTTNTLLSGMSASVTISAWVYVPSTSDRGAFVKVGSGPAINGYGLGVGTGSWDAVGNHLIGLYEGVRWIDTATSIGTGVHHVAMVISSSSVPSFYLDGNLLGSFAGSNPIAPTTPTAVGGYNNDGSHPRFFTGAIDQVLVYNKVLTATQILALYHSRLPGVPQVYIRPQTNGLPVTSRVPYEGTYLAAAAIYDARGNVRSVVDTGLPQALFYDMETCLATPCASGGSVVDLSSNSNNGLIGTGVTVAVGGKIGQAATFPGTATGYVAAPTSFVFPTASFTISFWTYPTALPASNTFFFGATSPTQGVDAVYALQNNGVFQCILVNSAGSYYSTPTATLSVNTWAHVACTFDGATYRLYINGVQQGSGTAFSGTPIAAQGNFEVGDYVGFTGMTGKIDEVHIIPQGLSLAQIVSDLYNGGTATTHVYSTLDGQDYRTQLNRPDGKQIYYAYDFQTGVKYGTLDVDCRRSRTQYDAIGRALQTSIYDTDSNEVLHLDMETATYNSLKDVSCAGTTDSRNGQTVSMGGTGTVDAVGRDGSARDFRGVGWSDYVRVANTGTLNPVSFSLSFWINPDTLPTSYVRIISKDTFNSPAGTYKGWTVLYNGQAPYGRIYLAIWNTANTEFDSQQVQLVVNQWQHVTFTFDGTNIRAYLNGVLQSCSCTLTGTFAPSTDDLIVGAGDSNLINTYFDGKLDEVRFFNAVRSATDIADLLRFNYKLLTSSAAAYDDMTAFPEFAGYPGTSVTSYDGVSMPRSLFFDMQTKKATINSINYLEDLSGNGNTGKVGTGVTLGVAGKVGTAASFPGTTTGYISASTRFIVPTAAFTTAFWVYPTSLPASNTFLFGATASGGSIDGVYGFQNNGNFQCNLVNTAGNYYGSPTGPLSLNTWNHVACVFDGATLRLYINGVEQGSGTVFSGTPKTADANYEVGDYIGFTGITGTMDDFQVIPRALSATEVSTLYNGYNQGTFTPQNYPTGNTGTTTNCGGTDSGDWTNPTNAYSSTDGGASATAAPSAGMIICTDWKTFTFNVPAGAVINSVKVTTSYKISGTSGNHYGLHVGLVDTNGGITNCPYQEDSSQPTVLTQVTFDFTSCKSWSSADFNSNNIKIDVGGHRGTGGGQAKTFSLDYVSIQVSYTVGSSNSIDGSHLSREYMDGLGRPVRQVVLDMYGNKIQTVATLGWNDEPTYSFTPSGGYFTYTYDFLGRTLTVQTPGDSVTSGISRTIVSEKARMIESIDAVGRKVYQKTDLLGRTVETAVWNPQTSAYGNLTSTTYNALSEVTVGRDAKLQTTTVYYNSLGKPKMTVFPDGTASVVYYDDNLRAFQTVDVMGRVAVSAYDNLGRVTSITLQPSLATSCTGAPNPCVVTYTYDPVHDELLTIDNITARITRTYDSLHRMKTEKLDVPSSSPSFTGTVTYDYDNAGKILNITYPVSGSPKAVYTYDSLGRVIQLDYGGSKYAVLTYDTFGRLDNIHYWKSSTDTALQEKYSYDARDRITQVKVFDSSQTYMQLDYTAYSKASEIVGSTDNMYVSDSGSNGVSNPKTVAYAYDGNGRLAQAAGPFGGSQYQSTLKYLYDQVGNLQNFFVNATNYVYGYGASPAWNRLDTFSYNSMSFAYNAAGSMLTKTENSVTTTYTQDFLQQLVKVVSGSNTYAYSYDGLGRRVETVDSNPAKTMYFTYAGNKMLYSKDATAGTETAYVYVGDKLLLRKDASAAQPSYYHQDVSPGNVRLITYYDTAVRVEARYRYRPFGDMFVLSGSTQRFQYAQQEYDGTGTGPRQYHMGLRYQDPVVGRFSQRDPIGPGYSYASNNPISYWDPTGTTTWFGEFANWLGTPQGRTAVSIVFLAVAVATAIPSGGSSLVAYAALAGGLVVGAIFVAYTYVASGGRATFDDYISAFTLGFTIGAVVGGGVGYAFKLMRAAPELAAARAATALPQSVKAEEAVAEGSLAGESAAGETGNTALTRWTHPPSLAVPERPGQLVWPGQKWSPRWMRGQGWLEIDAPPEGMDLARVGKSGEAGFHYGVGRPRDLVEAEARWGPFDLPGKDVIQEVHIRGGSPGWFRVHLSGEVEYNFAPAFIERLEETPLPFA